MMKHNDQTAHTASDDRRTFSRRRILLLIPATILTAVTTTLAAAAFRFLRPHAAPALPGGAGDSNWTPVAPIAELQGSHPLMRKISVEHQAGWSTMRREHAVYVLPQQTPQVVSAVCPHEGCDVDWNDETREFLCPCHDSRFNSGGARLSGPAQTGLTMIPSRVTNDMLEVQYRPAPIEAEQKPSTVRG